MSVCRVVRLNSTSRMVLRATIMIICCFLTIHMGLLILLRNGYHTPVFKGRHESTLDRRRDILQTIDEKQSNKSPGDTPMRIKGPPLEQAGQPERVQAETVHAETFLPEIKNVDIYEVVKYLTLERFIQIKRDIAKKEKVEHNKKEQTVVEAHTARIVSENLTQNKCIRYVTIYTPIMAPFLYWREYVNLAEAFKESRMVNSSYYNHRIKQRKFPTMFIECPEYDCDVALRPTTDKQFLASSDAIIVNMVPQEVRGRMHAISERLINTLPRRVKIFFYAMESPLMIGTWDHTFMNIKYHYSMTYHTESDVSFPYGRYVPGEPTDKEDINFAANKTGLLVWTASNCKETFWPRLEWVQRLEKLLEFDTYGKCGKKTCLPKLSPNCTQQQSAYKFYLALENSPCDEYITEKVWVTSLVFGLVPVVYGGRREAYERLAPPNSFIHVGDFASTQELVDYLRLVDKNDNLYNEFFAWRKLGRVENIYPDLYPKSFCRLLPKLSKLSSPPVKTVADSKYYQGCRGGSHRNFTQEGDIAKWTPWR